jgi:hypothetical protein
MMKLALAMLCLTAPMFAADCFCIDRDRARTLRAEARRAQLDASRYARQANLDAARERQRIALRIRTDVRRAQLQAQRDRAEARRDILRERRDFRRSFVQ